MLVANAPPLDYSFKAWLILFFDSRHDRWNPPGIAKLFGARNRGAPRPQITEREGQGGLRWMGGWTSPRFLVHSDPFSMVFHIEYIKSCTQMHISQYCATIKIHSIHQCISYIPSNALINPYITLRKDAGEAAESVNLRRKDHGFPAFFAFDW